MKRAGAFLGLSSLVYVALAIAPAAFAQDPLKVGSDVYSLAFENDHVRVLNVHFKPGAKVALHSHPDHIVYMISAGKLKLTHGDGKATDLDCKAGETLWTKAESHSVENVGGTDIKGVMIELKDKPKADSKKPDDARKDDIAKLSPDTNKVALENDRVRVLDVRLKPGGKMPMHSHPSHLVYALTDVKATFSAPDGKTTPSELKTGKTLWSGPVTHAVENSGSAEIHVLDIEFKELP